MLFKTTIQKLTARQRRKELLAIGAVLLSITEQSNRLASDVVPLVAAYRIENLSQEELQRRLSSSFAFYPGSVQLILQGARADAVRLQAEEHIYLLSKVLKKESLELSYSGRVYDAAYDIAANVRYKDGLQLSDRLWRNTKADRLAVQEIIVKGVNDGDGVDAVARKVRKFLVAEDSGSLYKAHRLAWNEMRQLHLASDMVFSRANDIRFGTKTLYRWELSSAHRKQDVCDVLASYNSGYGRGVYEVQNMPAYAHPHCKCIRQKVTLPPGVSGEDKFLPFTYPPARKPNMRGLDLEIHTEGMQWINQNRDRLPF